MIPAKSVAAGVSTPNPTGEAMTLYDFLQFSVGVFSILAAGFWLQSATSRLVKPATQPAAKGSVCFHKH